MMPSSWPDLSPLSLIRVVTQTATRQGQKAIFQAIDPSMAGHWLADARADLINPCVVWMKATNHPGWNRCSPVVELSVARRWERTWSKGGKVVAITPCHRISRPVTPFPF